MATQRVPNIRPIRLSTSKELGQYISRLHQPCRAFTSTPSYTAMHRRTLRRRLMENWLRGPGATYKTPTPGVPRYLGGSEETSSSLSSHSEGADGKDKNGKEARGKQPRVPSVLKPFPMNPYFRSEPVLGETMREQIYHRVIGRGQSIREVSIDLNVTMERVAAVTRLMSIEQEWLREGKPLSKGYQQTVLGMLPQTQWDDEMRRPSARHENINDLPVHSATTAQIFYPAPESKDFNRAEAGRVFSADLLAPDERIPHPEMIQDAKNRMAGMNESNRRSRLRQQIQEMEAQKQEEESLARKREEMRTKVVQGVRWDFRFKDVNVVDTVGKDGRGRKGVGWRYGAPHEDRKHGQIKIPTKVE